MPPAVTLKEVKKALDPRPLRADELEDLFVETSPARDPVINRRREIVDRLEEKGTVKILLAGHPGSGKSTELVKLRSEIDDRFTVAQLSVIEDGDPGNNTVEVVLVLIVEAVLKALAELGVEIPEKRIRPIELWFAETFEVDESKLDFSGSLGGGIDAKRSVWAKMLGLTAVLKADIRAGSARLRKTVREKEHRLGELAKRCRDLVQDAQLELRARGRELLLIVEDLDKAQIDEATDLFIKNPIPLAGLPAKAIFWAPILLFSNSRMGIVERYFEVEEFPVIKIESRTKERSEAGWQIIERILAKRIDLESGLIAHDAVELAIEKTGGLLRHLFQALYYAATAADQALRFGGRDVARITREDVRYGLNRVRSSLVRRIGTAGLPQEYREIAPGDLYRRLNQLCGKAECVASDKVNLLLLQAHALVEYNGEQWHRVHPLVEEHLEETADRVA